MRDPEFVVPGSVDGGCPSGVGPTSLDEGGFETFEVTNLGVPLRVFCGLS